MKKLLSSLLCLVLCICGTIALADTVTMGTNAAFAPFEFIGDDGQPTGFDVEIAQLIAADLGMELAIEDMYFDGLLVALETDMVDFIIAAMTINEERKESADFSTPYFNATQAVIVLEGYEGITAVEDILTKKVAVQDGTTGFFMVTDPVEDGGFGIDMANVAAFKASTDTVLELVNGKVDCIVIDDAVAKNFVATFDGLVILEGMEMPVEEYGIAVKKGNEELLSAINASLEKIMADGTYDALITKYFASDAE